MTDDVEITVRDSDTGHILLSAEGLRLPVELGRGGANDGGQITAADGRVEAFGADLAALSRQHLTVTPGPGGGLVVTDLSSNGVTARGGARDAAPRALGRGGSLEMPAGSMQIFDSVGLEITICAPKQAQVDRIGQPLHLVYESASSGRLKALDLDGVSIVLVASGRDVLMRRRPGTTAEVLETVTAEASAAEGDLACLLAIGPDGAGGVEARVGTAGEVAHNRRDLGAGAAVALDHLDTLEIRGQLLRIMSNEEGKGLSCSNATCRQMNPYLPGENCRYCGQRLGDGTSYWVHS